jgi:Holliday junction resolvase RusA-like endonuclease
MALFRAKKKARIQTKFMCLAALGDDPAAAAPLFKADRLNVRMTFIPDTRRRRDLDNLIAATKAHRDGISDALGLDDSRFLVTYELAEQPTRPAVVRVTLEVAT